MGATSAIEWTEATYNPWHGCLKVSPGCKFCYMYRDKERYGQDPRKVVKSSPATFNAPLKWKEPKLIFTCSWSDFFIDEADEWRGQAWEIIRNTPQHTYQILTKRPERIRHFLPDDWGTEGYPNVWLGTSVENQEYAEKRIFELLMVPARIRFLSCEPLLGPVDLREAMGANLWNRTCGLMERKNYPNHGKLHWVITGGESGSKDKIRPANLDWFRSIRDQCKEAGIAYFHKQHGGSSRINGIWGGRELDGQEYNEMPEVKK